MRHVNLKALRETKGFTHQEVADKAGISRSYYTTLENDMTECTYNPTVEIIKSLANVLDFAWEDYFNDTAG